MLEEALSDEISDLPAAVRAMGAIYVDQIARLTDAIERLGDELETASRTDAELQRLCTIPGIGPVTAGAVAAFAPDLGTFESGRNLAAWLGVVPRQRSTGGKAKLGLVSKMGQTDIRRLLIVGAMSMIRWVVCKGGSPNRWLANLVARKPKMVAAVALANSEQPRATGSSGLRTARTIWAVTTKQESYRMACPKPRHGAKARHGRKAGASDRRRVGDTDFEVQGRDIQTRGSSAGSSLNRCEPSLPNSMTHPWRHRSHILRPDTRPIEDPAEKSKIMLAKQGASTHVLAYVTPLVGASTASVQTEGISRTLQYLGWVPYLANQLASFVTSAARRSFGCRVRLVFTGCGLLDATSESNTNAEAK